jgi:hypothetical protein
MSEYLRHARLDRSSLPAGFERRAGDVKAVIDFTLP